MTSDNKIFPPLPPSKLNIDDVVRYLTGLVNEGHPVYRDQVQDNVFYIQLNDSYRIRVSVSEGRSQVQLHYLNNDTAYLNVTSLAELEQAIGDLVQKVPGMKWPYRPTSGRLNTTTPATNYHTISQLIGTSAIEGVFDPYLTNESLEELIVILSFGAGSIANGIRLLGSTAKTTGKIPKFSKKGVDAWLNQLGISGDARVVSTRSEHRRFLLLSGGYSLILGHSLNAIHKNEAIRVEADVVDKPFFDTIWSQATPL